MLKNNKIDEIFSWNEENSTYGTSGEKGQGLGLQLVQEFTILNKGTIVAESEKGVGTTFTVQLPVASIEHVKVPNPV